MTAQTLERPQDAPDRPQLGPDAVDIAEQALNRISELSETEVTRQFNAVMEASKRMHLPGLASNDVLQDVIEANPQLEPFIEIVHKTAEAVLERETIEADATDLADKLGLAADITGDQSILDRTLEAIEDTGDFSMESIKRVMEEAREKQEPYTVGRNRLYNSKRQRRMAAKVIQQAEKPEVTHNEDLSILNTRKVKMARHATAFSVDTSSYEELFKGTERASVQYDGTTHDLYETSLDDVHRLITSDEINRQT